MASGSKGGGGGGGGRGRPYGMMLLLAFGAAVLGVMILHKLRESRVFTLLIKDKDRELMALHLLYQKERESTREMKRKLDELKTKTYSLRTQKMELANKVAAIQSTVSSLRDEGRGLESTLEEKQNQIKMLQQKELETSRRENSQIVALKELLKQKEAEIGEMKHLIEKPTRIWSVVTDDPSNRAVNLIPVVSNKAENKMLEELDVNSNDNQLEITNHDGNKALAKSEEAKNVSRSTKTEMNHAEHIENLEKGENRTEENQKREEVIGDEKLSNGVANTESKRDNAMRTERGENGIELENPEGGDDLLPLKMSKDVMKLKKLERSGVIRRPRGIKGEYTHIKTNRRKMISGGATNSEIGVYGPTGGSSIQRDRNSDRNASVEDHGNTLRPETGNHESYNFTIDSQSKVSGERNFGIYEHSMDEGFRASSNKDDKLNSEVKDQEVKAVDEVINNVMQQQEKIEVDEMVSNLK